jgi:hypothetical protein
VSSCRRVVAASVPTASAAFVDKRLSVEVMADAQAADNREACPADISVRSRCSSP